MMNSKRWMHGVSSVLVIVGKEF